MQIKVAYTAGITLTLLAFSIYLGLMAFEKKWLAGRERLAT